MNKRTEWFGTDGIRAKAGSFPLEADFIAQIAAHAGAVLKERSPQAPAVVFLGQDTRASCRWIKESLVRGFSAGGVETLDCGMVPTSAIAVLLREHRAVGGVVISASHNPPEFNGIKFFHPNGSKIPDAWELEIEERVRSKNIAVSGTLLEKKFSSAQAEYLDFLLHSVPAGWQLLAPWIVDCANGAASAVAQKLFLNRGVPAQFIANHPDGNNINVNSGALHLEELGKKVRAEKAFGGFAFDGDADRVLFVDETGSVMDGDILIALCAQQLKRQGRLKNNTVVTTVMANLGFFKAMRALEIETLVTAVGDKSVAEGLETSGAILGGEQSGHIIFKNFLPTGDGLLSALQVVSLVQELGQPLSQLRRIVTKFPQKIVNLRVEEKLPVASCVELSRAIQAAEADLLDRGRVVVRYSGTEPLLRLMVEAESESLLKEWLLKLQTSAESDLKIIS